MPTHARDWRGSVWLSGGIYLPEAVHEALRQAAFKERCKIHDIIMEGIGTALKKRGYPPIDDLRAGRKR